MTTLKEKYLVSGNVVKTRNGEYYLVIGDNMCNEDGYNCISSYDDNMKLKNNSLLQFDIVAVYPTSNSILTCFNKIKNGGRGRTIWEREVGAKTDQETVNSLKSRIKEFQVALNDLSKQINEL